jgi:hypothetical protein
MLHDTTSLLLARLTGSASYILLQYKFSNVPTHKIQVRYLRSGVPRKFFGGVQQIQLRTGDRENGDLGAEGT